MTNLNSDEKINDEVSKDIAGGADATPTSEPKYKVDDIVELDNPSEYCLSPIGPVTYVRFMNGEWLYYVKPEGCLEGEYYNDKEIIRLVKRA